MKTRNALCFVIKIAEMEIIEDLGDPDLTREMKRKQKAIERVRGLLDSIDWKFWE